MFLKTHMTLHFCFGQGVHERFIHSLRRDGWDAQTHCQFVGRLEGNARQLYQSVRMLTDYVQRVLTILTIDLNGSAGGDPMGSQKCDHISGSTGGKVGISDLLQFSGTDTPDGHQLFRLVVQDIQSVLSKSIVDLLCDLRADTLDLA